MKEIVAGSLVFAALIFGCGVDDTQLINAKNKISIESDIDLSRCKRPIGKKGFNLKIVGCFDNKAIFETIDTPMYEIHDR